MDGRALQIFILFLPLQPELQRPDSRVNKLGAKLLLARPVLPYHPPRRAHQSNLKMQKQTTTNNVLHKSTYVSI
jgi:hypothetical protein